jgi:hypothetical protein
MYAGTAYSGHTLDRLNFFINPMVGSRRKPAFLLFNHYAWQHTNNAIIAAANGDTTP